MCWGCSDFEPDLFLEGMGLVLRDNVPSLCLAFFHGPWLVMLDLKIPESKSLSFDFGVQRSNDR